MIVKTITFMQTFPTGLYANQKLGIEIDVSEVLTQTELIKHFEYAKDTVNQAFKSLNPDLIPTLHDSNSGQPEVIQVDKGSDSAVEGIIKDIGNCPDLPNLNQYKWVKGSDPRIEEAFTKRLKELS